MPSSPGRFRGRPTAEPIMLKKAFAESPLLQELLPKATVQLALSLSNDDKEVLTYLIAYGRRVILTTGPSFSVCKSAWKPWKSASKVPRREQASSSFSFSDSCTESAGLGEEVSSKRTSWLFIHKASSTCDCFSCYSSFWSRWDASPNRDLINEILDVIEEGPKISKGKKKKRADKKRAVLGAEVSTGKPSDDTMRRATVHKTWASGLNEEGVMDIQTSRSPDLIHQACVAMTSASDGISHASIMIDEASMKAGHKKSMFRVMKQREEACVATLRSLDLRVNTVSGNTGINDEPLLVSGLVGANGMDSAVAIDVSGNLTTEASDVMAVDISPALLSAKNTSRLHRIAKRRHNRVIPLDCEGLLDVESEQETATIVEITQAPVSPRAADNGLGGRGFLARVFPDALGRVATRLWDLVSVRLRSRTVEYH